MFEFELSTSRVFDRSPGEGFRTTLELPGWENQSCWGYDEPVGSYFAQLWRNGGGDRERPEIWLSGVGAGYARPGSIALEILRSTEHDPLTIASAMGILDPEPQLRRTAEIDAQIAALTPDGAHRYIAAQIEALRWVLTGSRPGPGSEQAWLSGPPSAPQVEAEYHLVVGRLYERGGDNESLSGADEALMWALQRM